MKRTTQRVLFCSILAAMSSAAGAAVDVQKIALEGDAAPGAGAGTTIGQISTSGSGLVVGADGHVAFNSTLAGSLITPDVNDVGIFKFDNGTLAKAFQTGDSLSNLPSGATIKSLGAIGGAAGGYLFQTLTGQGGGITTANDSYYLVVDPSGIVHTVTHEGATDFGVSGTTLSTITAPHLAGNGSVTFTATYKTGGAITTSNDTALFFGSANSPSVVAREGANVNGIATTGTTAASLINGSGNTIYGSGKFASGGAISTANDDFRFVSDGSTITPFLREADSAPGTSTTFKTLSSFVASDNGNIAFQATLNDSLGAAYVGTPGNLHLVARAGTNAPAFIPAGPNGQPIIALVGNPSGVSASGKTAFTITMPNDTNTGITTSNNLAYVYGDQNDLKLIARTGDAVPGTNFTFQGLSTGIMNSAGDIAFLGTLDGGGTTDQVDDLGMFYFDPNFGVRMLLRLGDTLQLSPSELLTLNNTNTSSEGLNLLGLSDAGQVTFFANLADGRDGIFTVSVPEPASLSVLALGGLFMMRRRRTCR